MNARTNALLLVASIGAAACAPHDATKSNDDIWFPPTANGKADALDTLEGSEIPSAYVDPDARYLVERGIQALIDVSALDPVEESVARRADGVLASLPSDGRLHVAELVRLEKPGFFQTLFPDEKAALPALWERLVVPDNPPLSIAADLPLHHSRVSARRNGRGS